MAGYVKLGFKAVKMKVGRLSPAEEEARVRAAREAIGPDVLLTLDANNAWQDLPTALEHIKRYEKYDPYWIEEPFGPDDIDSHARLARATKITVATGEIGVGRWYFKELMEKGGAAILQLPLQPSLQRLPGLPGPGAQHCALLLHGGAVPRVCGAPQEIHLGGKRTAALGCSGRACVTGSDVRCTRPRAERL